MIGFNKKKTPSKHLKSGGSRVKSVCLSVDEFQDLLIQFGQVLKAKNFNGCCILLVGLDGPTLIKLIYEMRIWGVFLSGNGRVTQNSLWA